jgi:transcription initiation factor TFIIB
MAAAQHTVCPECRSSDIIADTAAGDVVCRGCGVVLGDHMIDDTAEWRVFADDGGSARSDPNRCSGPIKPGRGIHGKLIGGDPTTNSFLTKTQSKLDSHFSSDMALSKCNQRIQEMAAILSIPQATAEGACELLRQLDEAGEFKRKTGASGNAMCGAVLYLACRQEGATRTLDEVAPAATVGKREVAKAFKHALRHLRLQSRAARGDQLVPRCCGALGLPVTVTQVAKHVAEQCYAREVVTGAKPQAVAAASVWVAMQAALTLTGAVGLGTSMETVVTAAAASLAGTRNLAAALQRDQVLLLPPAVLHALKVHAAKVSSPSSSSSRSSSPAP